MTNEEKDIQKLIKTEKAQLIKIANEINALVLEHNFNRNNDLKYYISYELSSAGNSLIVRICDPNNGFNCVECKEVDLLSSIFNTTTYYYLSFDEWKTRIQRVKSDFIEMNKLVEKYIEINNQQ